MGIGNATSSISESAGSEHGCQDGKLGQSYIMSAVKK